MRHRSAGVSSTYLSSWLGPDDLTAGELALRPWPRSRAGQQSVFQALLELPAKTEREMRAMDISRASHSSSCHGVLVKPQCPDSIHRRKPRPREGRPCVKTRSWQTPRGGSVLGYARPCHFPGVSLEPRRVTGARMSTLKSPALPGGFCHLSAERILQRSAGVRAGKQRTRDLLCWLLTNSDLFFPPCANRRQQRAKWLLLLNP